MRPPASPSCRLYEPEAIVAYAYAPAGLRKIRKGEGFCMRSNLILFVLVLVLVLVKQNFIEDEGRGRRRRILYSIQS
jgi:hypothetical protein